MSCFIEKEKDNKIVAALIFERSQLLYDIGNYAYIEGDALPTDAGAHAKHLIQDVTEDGNVDRVTRVLNLGVSRCRERLQPYTNQPIKDAELNDKLKERKVYVIRLTLPSSFTQASLTFIEHLIHEYLVCSAVADWMSITHPGRVETWAIKAESAINEARLSLNQRSARVRRNLHPLW